MSDPRCLDCAGCCRGGPGLGVRVTPADVAREPALAAHAPAMALGGPCPFLDGTRCRVYATRPDACREFKVGGDGCRTVRQALGLPLLTSPG